MEDKVKAPDSAGPDGSHSASVNEWFMAIKDGASRKPVSQQQEHKRRIFTQNHCQHGADPFRLKSFSAGPLSAEDSEALSQRIRRVGKIGLTTNSQNQEFQIKCFSLEKYEKYYGELQNPLTAHCFENQKYKKVSVLGERYKKMFGLEKEPTLQIHTFSPSTKLTCLPDEQTFCDHSLCGEADGPEMVSLCQTLIATDRLRTESFPYFLELVSEALHPVCLEKASAVEICSPSITAVLSTFLRAAGTIHKHPSGLAIDIPHR
ncbi:hypothetical protein A6R68_07369, partial [Neotoma lepida]